MLVVQHFAFHDPQNAMKTTFGTSPATFPSHFATSENVFFCLFSWLLGSCIF